MSQRAARYLQEAVESLPQPTFVGDLIRDLEATVEAAETGNGSLHVLPEPEPPVKLDERDYIKFVAVGEIEMRCSNVDCHRPARLIAESRDGEVLPYCKDCAWVEMSTWMAGV